MEVRCFIPPRDIWYCWAPSLLSPTSAQKDFWMTLFQIFLVQIPWKTWPSSESDHLLIVSLLIMIKEGWRGRGLYRAILKIQCFALSISEHNASLFPLIVTRLQWLVLPQVCQLAKMGRVGWQVQTVFVAGVLERLTTLLAHTCP